MECDYCKAGIQDDEVLYFVVEEGSDIDYVCCEDCLEGVIADGMVIEVEDSHGDIIEFWNM